MRPADPGIVTAVLGPTNTGKTHLAVERMLARSSGMIGLPLRLLAREVYDRVVKARGAGSAALITGEEKIIPASARYFICTMEAMPMSKPAAFIALDEVQLAADPERGHVFTDRLLHARGSEETMLLGAATMRPLISRLIPEAGHDQRERFSSLSYAGPMKLTKLPRRSAIVAFSAESVYAIAEVLRRKRGGAAVVMGGLSPRTRNAQVELYQSGEVDYLVATDAIGMGLNMDVDHVAFAETRKFDGRRMRRLTSAELAQIAGRAGRFRSDGSFGETADQRPLDPEIIAAIEGHEFAPVEKLQWRNFDLDLSSLDSLRRSLDRRSPDAALERVREAIDEQALNELAADREVRERALTRDGVARLWDCCLLPDFRKATLDAHARLVKSIYLHLMGPGGCLPTDWLAGQLERLDRMGGDVDALAARLAHVRTWAYAAQRSDWTHNPEHWRERARDLEDRLSDALHEKLMQRFVDRRTSALMRGLRNEDDMLAGVSSDGEVTVEGHYLGRLDGLVFKPDARGPGLEARALRGAALKALRPEINRRLGALAKPDPATLALEEEGRILWAGTEVARLVSGDVVLRPEIRLIGGELGAPEAQSRAAEGLRAWLDREIAGKLAGLEALKTAAEGAELSGLARGLAWRLYEAGGVLARREALEEVRSLSPVERRQLRALGVRIGEHLIFMPALVKPAPARLNAILIAHGPEGIGRLFLPAPGLTSTPNDKSLPRRALAAAGYHACGPRAVRFDILEKLADLIRAARSAPDGPAEAPPPKKPDAKKPDAKKPDSEKPDSEKAELEQADTGKAGPKGPDRAENKQTGDAKPKPSKPSKPPKPGRNFTLTAEMMSLLGCNAEDLRGVLSALGYRRLKRGPEEAAIGEIWGPRRKGPPSRRMTAPSPPPTDTPFAALAALQTAPAAPKTAAPNTAAAKRRKPRRRTGRKTAPGSRS